ncbi:MAG TPA: hypothetical protein H9815_14545 [Candidatus Ruania gallistercoris]|uniref:Uncharacterized protein n=1 Tax=Candidatus Ruania gallistercoris TaxID=2838746 RepID=A0A9D2EG23_9MICO|nr:hypothetical protein [Candidatus Ruania gallistercoris]
MFDNVFDAIAAQRMGGPLDEPTKQSRRRPGTVNPYVPRRQRRNPEL